MKWTMLALLLLSGTAYARDPDGRYANSAFHDWFEQQTNARGGSCCRDADGHQYDGDYKMNDDGSVTLLSLPEGPYNIEAYKVLKSQNPTGHAVWWYETGYNGNKQTFCFSPGPLT